MTSLGNVELVELFQYVLTYIREEHSLCTMSQRRNRKLDDNNDITIYDVIISEDWQMAIIINIITYYFACVVA